MSRTTPKKRSGCPARSRSISARRDSQRSSPVSAGGCGIPRRTTLSRSRALPLWTPRGRLPARTRRSISSGAMRSRTGTPIQPAELGRRLQDVVLDSTENTPTPPATWARCKAASASRRAGPLGAPPCGPAVSSGNRDACVLALAAASSRRWPRTGSRPAADASARPLRAPCSRARRISDSADPRQVLGREDALDEFAPHLLCRPAQDPLGPGVPVRHPAVLGRWR